MANRSTGLSDAEWRRIEPLLPSGREGAHRVDGIAALRQARSLSAILLAAALTWWIN
jgi:transposase